MTAINWRTWPHLPAGMLGARRGGVTEAAGRLQKEGMIEYARGRITVMDRPALERRGRPGHALIAFLSSRMAALRPAHSMT